MAIVQAMKGSAYLPLKFDTSVIAGYNGMTTGLWKLPEGAVFGKVSLCALQNSSPGASVTDDEVNVYRTKLASAGLTLMTTPGGTNAYSNLAALGSNNFFEHLNNFNSDDKYLLTSITNSRISDIVLVPYVTACKYSDTTLAGTTTSLTAGYQTFEYSSYVSSGYINRPHVVGVSFAVYCHTATTPDGFDVTKAATNRVRIANTSAGGEKITVNGRSVNLVPASATRASEIINAYVMNTNASYEDALSTSKCWITGANTFWDFSLRGNFSTPQRVNDGGLLRMNREYGSDTNPSFGGNYRWYSSDIVTSPLVTNIGYIRKSVSNLNYTGAIFFIDCSAGVAPLRTAINMLGFMWVDSTSKAARTIPGEADAHCPVFSNGVPTGEDTIGETETEKHPVDTSEIPDDPTPEPEPEPEPEPVTPPGTIGPDGGVVTGVVKEPDQVDDITNGNISTGGIGRISGTRKFVCVSNTIQSFINYISSTYQPTSEEFTKDFKGTNPIDYVVSCKLFPFAPSSGNSQVIGLGGISTGISAAQFADASVKILDMGYVTVTPKYNSWLDYKPYTTIKLYVPFCGEMDLDPAIWMGRACRVLIAVDMETGACTALVFRDNTLFGTLEGVMGFDVQLFGARQGDYQNQIYAAQFSSQQAKRAETQTTLNAIGNVIGLSKGGADSFASTATATETAGKVSGGIGMAQAALNMPIAFASGMNSVEGARERVKFSEWQVNHIAPSFTSSGTQDPLTNFALSPYCRLIYTRAQMLGGINVDMYRRTVGYACMATGTVGSFDDLIVCGGVVKTTGNLFAAEVDAIKAKLAQGVYVKAT